MGRHRILILNTTAGGSTGRLAATVASAAAGSGHDVVLGFGRGPCPPSGVEAGIHARGRCAAPPTPEASWRALRCPATTATILSDVAATRLFDRHGDASPLLAASTRRFLKQMDDFDPDILHLHNIHGYWIHRPTLAAWIRSRAGRMRTVWTLHDTWAYTGHCAWYSATGCRRWADDEGCRGKCPMRRNYPASWFPGSVAAAFERKRRDLSGLPGLEIVAVSRWLDSEVGASVLAEYPRTVIHNPVDTECFNPGAASPSGAPTVLAAAAVWTSAKGLYDLVELRHRLPAGYRMRVAGLSPRKARKLGIGIEGLGHITSPASMAILYASSDVFVNPTYAESYGMTKIEALACGTPVVTYDSAAAAEDIAGQPDSAAIVGTGDTSALARETIRLAEAAHRDSSRRAACRKLAESVVHTPAETTEAYMRLFFGK